MEKPKLSYHVFIAHSAADHEIATRLYHSLLGRYQVFLASKSILPGDYWDDEIAKAQRESLLTVILISPNTDSAFFQREEIVTAIELARVEASRHRVVPIYLDFVGETPIVPYGLHRIQAIHAGERDDIFSIIAKLEPLLKRIRGSRKYISRSRAKGTKLPQQNVTNQETFGTKHQIALRVETELEDIRLAHEQLGTSVCLLYMDLDSFTGINKRFGTEIGERIIGVVTEKLQGVAQGHFFTRLYGDEFLVCLENLTERQAVEWSQHLLKSIKDHPWSSLAFDLHVTASIGVAKLIATEQTRDWFLRAIHGSILAKRENGDRVSTGPLVLPKSISRNIEDYSS